MESRKALHRTGIFFILAAVLCLLPTLASAVPTNIIYDGSTSATVDTSPIEAGGTHTIPSSDGTLSNRGGNLFHSFVRLMGIGHIGWLLLVFWLGTKLEHVRLTAPLAIG